MSKNIVILGAGFAGLRCAQDLSRKLKNSSYKIILIDKNDFHLFRADLYEVATAYSGKVNKQFWDDLKHAVGTPIKKIIDSKRIKFLQTEVLNIDKIKNEVLLANSQKIRFEYLVVALGSVVNFYGIPGAEKYAFTFKTLEDALKLNKYFYDFFQKRGQQNKKISVVIGGGGATGIELAAELSLFLNKLCKQYHCNRENIEIEIVEGLNKLASLDNNDKEIILNRLKKLNIKVSLNSFIKKVTANKIYLESNGQQQVINCDILIWTAGVKINSVVIKNLGDKKYGGAALVNQFLQMSTARKVFLAGDNAYFIFKKSRLPMLAWVAYQEGAMIANNILRLIDGKKLIVYRPMKLKMVIPLGGKFGIMKVRRKLYRGLFPWIYKRYLTFSYLLSIMPFSLAVKRLLHTHKIFDRND